MHEQPMGASRGTKPRAGRGGWGEGEEGVGVADDGRAV